MDAPRPRRPRRHPACPQDLLGLMRAVPKLQLSPESLLLDALEPGRGVLPRPQDSADHCQKDALSHLDFPQVEAAATISSACETMDALMALLGWTTKAVEGGNATSDAFQALGVGFDLSKCSRLSALLVHPCLSNLCLQ